MTVNNYIDELLKENEENPQIVAIYDEKHNLHYLGKVAYAPMNCWFPFKNARMVGNELRINDIAEETESTKEIIDGSESTEEITV